MRTCRHIPSVTASTNVQRRRPSSIRRTTQRNREHKETYMQNFQSEQAKNHDQSEQEMRRLPRHHLQPEVRII